MASIKELSNYRLEKSKRNLELSKNLVLDEYYNFAINRAYYAAFDAMRAVNTLDGFDSSKHSGVISHFNQNHVKTGHIDTETSKIIKKASRLREKSDYEDFFEATKEEAEDAVKQVEKFIKAVESFLKGKIMANQNTIDNVKKLLSGHCYAPLREAAEAWLSKVGTDAEGEATAKMIPLLKDGIATVDEMLALFGSDEGKTKFGEELAGQIYSHAKDLQEKGEKYCDCDACKTALNILIKLK